MIWFLLLKMFSAIVSVSLAAGILARDHGLKANRLIAAAWFVPLGVGARSSRHVRIALVMTWCQQVSMASAAAEGLAVSFALAAAPIPCLAGRLRRRIQHVPSGSLRDADACRGQFRQPDPFPTASVRVRSGWRALPL